MADINKLNEELEKYLGESTLGYLDQAEDMREKMKILLGENQTFTPSILESVKQFEEIMEHKNIPLAFQSAEEYKHFISPYQSALEEKNFDTLQSSLGLAMSSYLKPEYSATLQALESAKDGLAYALTHNVDGTNYLESLKNTALGIRDDEHLLDAAKRFSTIASSIDSDIYKSEMSRLLDEPEHYRSYLDDTSPQQKPIELPNIPMPPAFEETPFGSSFQRLIGHSEQQISLLKMMATHMEKQKEHTVRQITLMDLQIQKTEEQVISLKTQNNALNQQNEMIATQAKSADKSAGEALYWVKITLIVTILLSIIVSTVVYFAQDYSDEKNHKELMQAVNDKKALEGQLSQLQTQIANQNEFIRLMKEQNGYLKKIEIQKQSTIKQTPKMVK